MKLTDEQFEQFFGIPRSASPEQILARLADLIRENQRLKETNETA